MTNQVTQEALSIDMGERLPEPPFHVMAKDPDKFVNMTVKEKVEYLINSCVVNISPN